VSVHRIAIGTLFLTLTACAQLGFVEQNLSDCAFEAEKATITLERPEVRRQRNDEFTRSCMRARGFELKDNGDAKRASSYRRARWF
jgi:hypothetical protein